MPQSSCKDITCQKYFCQIHQKQDRAQNIAYHDFTALELQDDTGPAHLLTSSSVQHHSKEDLIVTGLRESINTGAKLL